MTASDFYDWASPVMDFIAAISWPLIVMIAVVMFRVPLKTVLGALDEFDLWGAKAKARRGNERALELRADTAEDADGDQDRQSNSAEDPSSDRTEPDDVAADVLGITPLGIMNFYERIVTDRLTRSTYNTRTTSAKLGAEIVGNSYADLKQLLRVVHFLFFGIGQRGRLRSTERMLEDLTLPADLASDLERARRFAIDVHERREVVDGEGAEAYIKTVVALVQRLCEWGRPRLDQLEIDGLQSGAGRYMSIPKSTAVSTPSGT